MANLTITLSPEQYARVLSLVPADKAAAFCITAIDEAIARRRTVTAPKQGRPAPPVPKSKRSLYLDEQVWAALEAESERQKPAPGISAVANQRLRESFNLDEE